jgi:hypothetical protein
MAAKLHDVVRITSRASKYNGIEGEVFLVDDESHYAIVDMPKGTELRLEGIADNTIIARMKRAEKKRITPLARWPSGDPQWFPLEWLHVVVEAKDATSDEAELAIAFEE